MLPPPQQTQPATHFSDFGDTGHFIEGTTHFWSHDPTSKDTLLISFRLSSDAEIFVNNH